MNKIINAFYYKTKVAYAQAMFDNKQAQNAFIKSMKLLDFIELIEKKSKYFYYLFKLIYD